MKVHQEQTVISVLERGVGGNAASRWLFERLGFETIEEKTATRVNGESTVTYQLPMGETGDEYEVDQRQNQSRGLTCTITARADLPSSIPRREEKLGEPPWNGLFSKTPEAERGAIVSPAEAEEARDILGDRGQVVHIAGAGHSVRREQFQAFMDATTRFLKRCSTPSPESSERQRTNEKEREDFPPLLSP